MEYQPITKERAAEILGVSKRTIDNFLADSTLPRPTYIGRRVYWHPTVFYGWLDARLGVGEAAASGTLAQALSAPKRTGRPRKSGR